MSENDHGPEAVVERLDESLDVGAGFLTDALGDLQPGDILPSGLVVGEAKGVEEAVAAEREACAEIAGYWNRPPNKETHNDIAAAIRARKP